MQSPRGTLPIASSPWARHTHTACAHMTTASGIRTSRPRPSFCSPQPRPRVELSQGRSNVWGSGRWSRPRPPPLHPCPVAKGGTGSVLAPPLASVPCRSPMTTVIVHSAVSLLETCLCSIAIGSPVLMSRFSPAQWHALWTHPPAVASLMTIVGTADTTTIRVAALITMMSAFNSCHCRDAAYVTGLLDTATSQLGYTPGDFSGTRDGGRPPIAQSATESGLVQLQRLVLAALNTGIRKSFGPVATKRPGFTRATPTRRAARGRATRRRGRGWPSSRRTPRWSWQRWTRSISACGTRN